VYYPPSSPVTFSCCFCKYSFFVLSLSLYERTRAEPSFSLVQCCSFDFCSHRSCPCRLYIDFKRRTTSRFRLSSTPTRKHPLRVPSCRRIEIDRHQFRIRDGCPTICFTRSRIWCSRYVFPLSSLSVSHLTFRSSSRIHSPRRTPLLSAYFLNLDSPRLLSLPFILLPPSNPPLLFSSRTTFLPDPCTHFTGIQEEYYESR